MLHAYLGRAVMELGIFAVGLFQMRHCRQLTGVLALAVACFYDQVSDAHHFVINIFLSVLYQWTFNLHIKCNKVVNHFVPP